MTDYSKINQENKMIDPFVFLKIFGISKEDLSLYELYLSIFILEIKTEKFWKLVLNNLK